MTSNSPNIGPGQLLLLDIGGDVRSEWRILGVDPAGDSVWVIDCRSEKRGLPIDIGYRQTMRRIREGDAKIEKVDPHVVYPGTNPRLSEQQKAIWEKSWSAIAPLVAHDNHELLLCKGSRGECLRNRAAQFIVWT